MNVLITGATGFVGGQLLRHLSEKPDLRLIATGRSVCLQPESARRAGLYISADLSIGCPQVSADVCIHAAGLADDRSTASELQRHNVDATRNLLESLQNCRRFIFISSASVYGLQSDPLRESDATAESALSAYGRSKWAAEQVVAEVCKRRGIEYVILRPRAIYGVGDRVLLPRLVRLMRPPFLLTIGPGLKPISLTYVGHLAALVEMLVFAERVECGTFNVADSDAYQFRGVLAMLHEAIHGRPPRIVRIPIALLRAYVAVCELFGRTGALTRQSLLYVTEPCVLDCTAARNALGYAPDTTFMNHVEAIACGQRETLPRIRSHESTEREVTP
ncbi:MAG TPA: NAD-dependent epimerase/dehydratase family protein [Thermoanaerobaculia bacterium]